MCHPCKKCLQGWLCFLSFPPVIRDIADDAGELVHRQTCFAANLRLFGVDIGPARQLEEPAFGTGIEAAASRLVAVAEAIVGELDDGVALLQARSRSLMKAETTTAPPRAACITASACCSKRSMSARWQIRLTLRGRKRIERLPR